MKSSGSGPQVAILKVEPRIARLEVPHPELLSVTAAHPGVTVPHEWTRWGRRRCVIAIIAIIAIRVIGP
jgi:hypothetical protein